MEKQAIFTIRVNTQGADKAVDSTAKSMDNLQKSTKAAATENKSFEDRLKAVNQTVQNGEFSMRGASKLIQEYQQIAMQAGRESPVGREAIAQAAALTDKVTDLRNEVKRLSQDGQAMQGALAIGSTVVAGYGAFKGVTAMLGVENEKLMETMVKMQAAQQVLMGIEQIRKAMEKESQLMQAKRAIIDKAQIVRDYLMAASKSVLTVAIGAATGAAKLFRLALIATGLGAIVVGIGMLIAHFDKVSAAVKFAVNKFNELGDGVKLALSIIFPFIGAIRLVVGAMEKMGIIDSEEASAAKKLAAAKQKALQEETEARRKMNNLAISENEKMRLSINDKYDHEIAKAKAAGKDTFDLEKAKRAEMLKTFEHDILLLEESLKLNGANYEEMLNIIKKIGEAKRNISTLTNEQELADIQRSTDADKKALDEKTKNLEAQAELDRKAKEKKAEQEKLDLERKMLFEDLMLANIEDVALREEMQRKEKFKREEADLIAKFGNDTALLFELKEKQRLEVEALDKAQSDKDKARDAAARKTELELQIQALQDDFEAQMAVKEMLWEMEREAELANKELTEQELANIEEKYRLKAVALNQEKTDKQLEQETALNDAIVNIQEQGMTAIQGLADAVFAIRGRNMEKDSKAELALRKKQFQVNKAMQLAGAIISGYRTALSAYGSQIILGDPTSIVRAKLAAGVAGAMAAGNIAKIAATKFEGGGGITPDTGEDVPSMAAQQAPSTLQAGELTNQNQQESTTRVAVLESDITRTQNRITDIEVRTTF